jgi:Protein of unknown function (DUF433)
MSACTDRRLLDHAVSLGDGLLEQLQRYQLAGPERTDRPPTDWRTLAMLRPWKLGRTMEPEGRIEINPRVMLGKPVIRGTRMTVELILRKLSEVPLRRICSTPIPG